MSDSVRGACARFTLRAWFLPGENRTSEAPLHMTRDAVTYDSKSSDLFVTYDATISFPLPIGLGVSVGMIEVGLQRHVVDVLAVPGSRNQMESISFNFHEFLHEFPYNLGINVHEFP